MSDERAILRDKLGGLLSWERIKRREKILLSVSFYSVLASVITLPARNFLPAWAGPYSVPLFFFFLLAPILFFLNRWGERESLRTLSGLDRVLCLEERAITAWEILSRSARSASEQLVLEETGEKLQGLDARSLFQRHLTWDAYLVLPLFLLWLVLVGLDVGIRYEKGFKPGPKSMAQKLREFSDELLERAKSQELAESAKVAGELDQIARQGLKKEISEKKLGETLAQIATRIRDIGRTASTGSEFLSAAATQEGLMDLRAELEALKESLGSPEIGTGGRGIGPDLLGRLGSFPRLKREVQRGLAPGDRLGEKEFGQFLKKLERDLARELDRRGLADTREFIELLLESEGGRAGQKGQQLAGVPKEGMPEEGERVRGKGTLPGDEPGRKDRLPGTSPSSQARAATHLKGILGEGKSGTVIFRGMPSAGRSEVSQEEVAASYRRQAEEDLASERIPQELREPIRNYFLSLGMMGESNPSSGTSRQSAGKRGD